MARWMCTQEGAGQERHPFTFVLNPSSRRDEIVGSRVRVAARWKRKAKEGLKKGRTHGEARWCLFLREMEDSERASAVDSLLFCQTSDAPAP